MRRLGGVELIDFKRLDLSTITSIPQEIIKLIVANGKHVVLTNILLGGIAQKDIVVSVELDGTNVILKNVYGYDLSINLSTNVLTKTSVSGGGSQLYKHVVWFKDDSDAEFRLTLISNDNTPIVASNIVSMVANSISAHFSPDASLDVVFNLEYCDLDNNTITFGNAELHPEYIITTNDVVTSL